jgi:tetratricopeptide (TPR) repeat protein
VALAQGGARADAGDAAAARARFKSGQEAFRSGQLAEAERAFLEAIRLDPALVAARCALGQAYMALKQYGGAVEALTTCKAETLRQQDLSQADAAKLDQQRDEEIQQLRDTLRLLDANTEKAMGPDKATGINKRIHELEMQKARGDRAQLPPEIPFSLGTALLRMGSWDAAERELLEATKARPGYGEAHNNLAAVYVGKGQWEQAQAQVALAEKAGFKVPPQLVADIQAKHSSMTVAPPSVAESKLPQVPVAARPLRIDHDPVDCVLADAFPEIDARIDSEDGPKATLRFRAEGESRWYAVSMFPRDQVFAAVLPKPKGGAKGIEYSIHATDRSSGKAETQAFRAAVVEKADGCAGKRLSALAIAPAQIDVEVPEGTRSLPPGFSEKNVVGRYESGKPVKGHPRTALFAVLGAGAGAAGLSQITGHKDPVPGQIQLQYIRVSSSNPPQGSTVSLKSGLMLTLGIDIAAVVPPGGRVTLDLHAGPADGSPSCLTLTGGLPGGLRSFTPIEVPMGPGFAAINAACGSAFDVTVGRVVILGAGGVYAQTSADQFAGFLDVPIQYRFTP